MALIGLKYIAAAKAEYTESSVTFSEGKRIGKGITINKSNEYSETKLYADNELAESDESFSKGTLTINTDDYGFKKEDVLPVQAYLFGHEYKPANESEPEQLIKSSSDKRPFLGIAYIKTRKKNGELSYEVTLIYKVKFNPSAEDSKTKGESVEFSTPTITGSVYTCAADGKQDAYEKVLEFDTYEEAVTFIKELFSIT